MVVYSCNGGNIVRSDKDGNIMVDFYNGENLIVGADRDGIKIVRSDKLGI
jgi:hypothetical protein